MIEALTQILDILNRLDKVTDAVPKPPISDIVRKNIIPSEGGSTFDIAAKVKSALTNAEKQRVANTAKVWYSVAPQVKSVSKFDVSKVTTPEDRRATTKFKLTKLAAPEERKPIKAFNVRALADKYKSPVEEHKPAPVAPLIDYKRLATTLVDTYFRELQKRQADTKERVITGTGRLPVQSQAKQSISASLSKKDKGDTGGGILSGLSGLLNSGGGLVGLAASIGLIVPALKGLLPVVGGIVSKLPMIYAAFEGFQAIRGIVTEAGRKEARALIESQAELTAKEGFEGAGKNFVANVVNPGKALSGIVVGAYDTLESVNNYAIESYRAYQTNEQFSKLAELTARYNDKQIDQAKLLKLIKENNTEAINAYMSSLQDKNDARKLLDESAIKSKELIGKRMYKVAGSDRSILAAMIAAGKQQGVAAQDVFEDFKAKSEEYSTTTNDARKQELREYFHQWQILRDKMYQGNQVTLPQISVTPKVNITKAEPIGVITQTTENYTKIDQILQPPLEVTTTAAPFIEKAEITTTPQPMLAAPVSISVPESQPQVTVNVTEMQDQLAKSHAVLQRIAFFGEETYKVLKTKGQVSAQSTQSNQVVAPVMRGGDSVNKPDSRAGYFNSAYSLNVPSVAN